VPQGISLGGTQPVPVSGAAHSRGRSGAPIKKRRRFFGIAVSFVKERRNDTKTNGKKPK